MELDLTMPVSALPSSAFPCVLFAPSAEPITIPLTPDLEARYRAYLDSGLRWGST